MANVTAAADREQERQRQRSAKQESRQSKRHEPGAPMNHRQIMEALTGLLAAFFTAILSSTIVANALPTMTASAPQASALQTSPPLLIPPSVIIGTYRDVFLK